MKEIGSILLLSISLLGVCSAQNPFITHMYTADPSARVFNDTLYIYPSHDEDTATWFSMVDRLYYNEDGSIKKVTPTKEGVSPVL